jgi:O-antigen/teichoic acid export membrane protein
VALHQGISSWLRLGIAAVLVAWWSASAASVLWGFALGAAVTMASQWVFYRRMKGRLSPCVAAMDAAEIERHWYTSMTSCAWPYVIWSVPAWLQFSSDRWALEWLVSPAEVGVYAALFQLAFLPINTLTQLVTQLAMPILFARAGDMTDAGRVAGSRSLLRKLVWTAGCWTVLAAGAVAVVQVPLGRLLLDSRYHGSLSLLPLLVLAAGLFATAQLAELNIVTANRTAALIWPKSVVAVLACVAYFAGAYCGGIAGVIWASVLSRGGFLVWILHIDRQLLLPVGD